MKFLFVFYLPGGGIDPLNRYRCEALRLLGHESHCLYYRPGPGEQNITNMPTFITNDDEEIRGILEDQQYDFVIATTDHFAFPRFRELGFKGKFILEIQGYGAQEVARRELTNAVSLIETHASALLNPKTPHIAALFEELFPSIPKFNFNNPFNVSSFKPIPSRRRKLPIVAWIGRIEDNKNWQEFLRIAYRLVKYKRVKFWVYEDPTFTSQTDRADFFNRIKRLKLSRYIKIRHNVPHATMMKHYSMIGASGGFLLSTSKEEGAPYSFLEAMNCRCPVLSSEKDGIYSSLIHNVTGKMYPLGKVKRAVKLSLHLLNRPMIRRTLIKQARKHVRTNFSLEAYARNFMNMIESIK